MPFVQKHFTIDTPIPAFLFVMRTLKITQGESQRLIHKGRVIAKNEVLKSPGQIISGDISITIFEPEPVDMPPLFSTNDFMLFDKPSGILVHPTTRYTPFSMLDAMRQYGGVEANPAHRIDRETSGLLLASKHKEAEILIKGGFENRMIYKSYLAWVDGKITDSFEVDVPLQKNEDFEFNKHKVTVEKSGKLSHTSFSPVQYDSHLDSTLVQCFPHTGRMHQIRVHLFHVKHPILGDPIYGVPFEISNAYLDKVLSVEDRALYTGASRLMLHAHSLDFSYNGVNYKIKSKINFEDLKSLIVPKNTRKFNA
ncbi:MAG: RluA family pseudouridine synthase [Sulfurovaceae bacterium]